MTGNDIQFAVETRVYEGNWKKATKDKYGTNYRHYKQVAAYCTAAITAPENIRYYFDGEPLWIMENLIVIDHSVPVVEFEKRGGGVRYYPDYTTQATYGPVKYVVRAMMNAVKSVRENAMQEMTNALIEKEFALAHGTVHQYIRDCKFDIVNRGIVRETDTHEWVCRRGWALSVWGGQAVR